jgi:branched-subunit amino acid transport protein
VFERLLFTTEGRRVLLGIYAVAGVVTIIVYWVTHSPAYGLVQGAILGFAAFWVRWCLGRTPR